MIASSMLSFTVKSEHSQWLSSHQQQDTHNSPPAYPQHQHAVTSTLLLTAKYCWIPMSNTPFSHTCLASNSYMLLKPFSPLPQDNLANFHWYFEYDEHFAYKIWWNHICGTEFNFPVTKMILACQKPHFTSTHKHKARFTYHLDS